MVQVKNISNAVASSSKTVNVAVGVIERDRQFFVCRRHRNQHQGGKWEFPGGKIEAGETAKAALQRELKEEVGISVLGCEDLLMVEFSYPDKSVCLHVMLVREFTGSAYGAEGQDSQWVDFSQLCQLDFPDANQKIITKLKTRF